MVHYATVAQLVERLTCNEDVAGSTPAGGSTELLIEKEVFGEMPERPKGADCKSAGVCLRRFESFSPHRRECSSMVEPQPSKLVMSVRSRSLARVAYVAQSVERFLGKEEVTGSNPVVGSPNSK